MKLALTISTGAPITDPNDAMEMEPLVEDKKLKISQNSQKKQLITEIFTHKFSFFSLSNEIDSKFTYFIKFKLLII